MSSSQNRYGIYRQSRPPRQKRTNLMPGDLEDSSKWFKCWNCGFPCNVDRDTLDQGEYGQAGNTTPTSYTDVDAVTKYKPNITKGCPFCGCTNYR